MIVDSEPDIKNCVDQLERCINILIPKPEDLFISEEASNENKTKRYVQFETETQPSTSSGTDAGKEEESDSDDSDDGFEEVPMDKKVDEDIELRYLGFLEDKGSEFNRNYNLELNLNLEVDEENKIVIEIMKDLYKELKNSHLKKITLWIKV